MITNTHLEKFHGISPHQYLEEYPEAKLYDDEMHQKIIKSRYSVERPVCKREGCSEIVTQSWNKYCSYSCSNKERMSRVYQSGPDNPSWTDGWYSIGKRNKRKARERDKYMCRKCQKIVKGKAAHVHHMIPERCFDDPNEAHDLNNLVTLCDSCHLKIEWEVIRELHHRAYALDEMLKEDSNHISFDNFKENLLKSGIDE